MNLKPMRGHVLVARDAAIQKIGAIELPESIHQKATRGTVVALGNVDRLDNGFEIPFSVDVGTRIIFNRHSGQETVFQDKEYLTMREADIVAVIDDE